MRSLMMLFTSAALFIVPISASGADDVPVTVIEAGKTDKLDCGDVVGAVRFGSIVGPRTFIGFYYGGNHGTLWCEKGSFRREKTFECRTTLQETFDRAKKIAYFTCAENP